jgi:hypothetical protein
MRPMFTISLLHPYTEQHVPFLYVYIDQSLTSNQWTRIIEFLKSSLIYLFPHSLSSLIETLKSLLHSHGSLRLTTEWVQSSTDIQYWPPMPRMIFTFSDDWNHGVDLYDESLIEHIMTQ